MSVQTFELHRTHQFLLDDEFYPPQIFAFLSSKISGLIDIFTLIQTHLLTY